MFRKSKFFPQFLEKIEKLKLSLSKHHNKMLKIGSEKLKIRKTGKTIKLVKNSSETSRIPEIPRIFGIPKFPGIPGNFFENFSFPGKLKIRGKAKP